jgi:flagellar biosynthesis chaperone FliJ
MNKLRRKQLDEIIAKIQDISEELESVMNDEEEYRDNMPENLQGSEKYEMADSACGSMQEAIDQLDEAITNIESSQE